MSPLKLALVCLALAAAVEAQGLPDNLTVTSTTPPPYQANLSVQTSGTVTVNSTTTTTYTGGSQVVLMPGFTAIGQSTTPTFIANIAPPPFYPNNGSGGGQNFYVTASDPGGYQNITNIQIIYNWQPSGVDGCMINYDVVNDALSLGDLTGSMSTFGSISLLNPTQTLGDLVNSNCQIIGLGSSVTTSGNNITLFLNTHFRAPTGSGDPTTNPPGVPGFIGPQNIYMLTTSADQQQPGSFQLVGTWTPFAAPEPSASPIIASPSSVNSDGTITVQFNDSNGFNYMPYVQLVIGASQTDPNACRILYARGSGAANHVLSLYAGDFNQVSLIGIAPVGTPGAIVQNNNTCILDMGSSYVSSETGTGDSVNLALTFKTAGTFNTYLQAFDRQGVAGQTQNSLLPPTGNISMLQVVPVAVQPGGSSQQTGLTIATVGSLSQPISLTCSAPTGITVSTCPTSVQLDGSGQAFVPLSVSASASAATGVYMPTVTAMFGSGSVYVKTVVPVTVAGGAPPFPFLSFSAEPTAIQTTFGTPVYFTLVVAGFNGWNEPVQIYSVTPTVGTSVCFVVSPTSCVESFTAAPPVIVTAQLTINSTSGGSHSGTAVFVGSLALPAGAAQEGIVEVFYPPVDVVPTGPIPTSIQLSLPTLLMVPAGGSVNVPLSVLTQGSSLTSVTLSSGNDVTFGQSTFYSLSSANLPPVTTVTFSAGSRTEGTIYSETIYGTNAPSQTVWLTVGPPAAGANFTIATPTPLTLSNTGGTATSTVTISPQGSFASAVSLAFTNSSWPTGLTASFSPTSVSGSPWTSTITVTTTASTPPGSYSLVFTGTAAGGLTYSNSLTVNVVYASTLPMLTSVTPLHGMAGSVVTLNGENLGATQNGNFVTFGNVTAGVVSWGTNSIKVQVPYILAPGNYNIALNGSSTNTIPFTVDPGSSPSKEYIRLGGRVVAIEIVH